MSLETLWALCVALNIPFARLQEPQVNTPPGDPPRRGDESDCRAGKLSGDFTRRLPAGRAARYLSPANPAGG
ncbi:hypothetical protein RW69_03090 [Escherichia coli]|nr:hypothetical protein RW69_03090 [Escherichia coli]